MADYSIKWNAKWYATNYDAKLIDGVWGYSIDKRFVPVNEIALPYMLDHLDPIDAIRVLHGSTAVNLLQGYNGINLDLSSMALSAGRFVNHFFLTDVERADSGTTTTGAVAEGDSILVLVPLD
jgi:hypothetical protein